MWTIVVIIIVGVFIKFFYDTNKQKKHVSRQGGMQNKYRGLIDHIKSLDSKTEIHNDTEDSLTLEQSRLSSITFFTITQTYGKVKIQWENENSHSGKHNLEWLFDEYLDQDVMIKKITNDITSYLKNVFTSNENPEISNDKSKEYSTNDESNNKKWQTLLNDDGIKSDFKEIINQFLIPYDIDPIKFLINKDIQLHPYKLVTHRNDEKFSKTLQKFLEKPGLKARGFPNWFYCAFPDVAMWISNGEGNKILRSELSHLEEHEFIDLNRKKIKEKYLKRFIDLYKNNYNLECSTNYNDNS